ncbi:MAG: hypothetical protein ACLFS3_01220 [Candidatus Aenigmatarchaeota archaeon]
MSLKEIKKKFREWRERVSEEPSYPELYEIALSLVGNMNTKGETIRRFCQEVELENLDGLFLSALINTCEEEKIELANLEKVDFVGYRNQRKIKIDGSVGRHLGEAMSEGRIVVHGDAGERAGEEMSGGVITIKGDSGPRTGLGMTGGKIIVKGETGEEAGWCKKGGEIIDK